MRGYLKFVKFTSSTYRIAGFRFPFYYVTMIAAIGIVVASVAAMLQIPGSFLPPEDVSRISISVELPPGSTLEQTDITTKEIVAAIDDIDWIDNIFVLGGASPTGEMDVRRASVTVILDKLDHSLVLKLSQAFGAIPVVGAIVPVIKDNGRTVPQNEIEAEIFNPQLKFNRNTKAEVCTSALPIPYKRLPHWCYTIFND